VVHTNPHFSFSALSELSPKSSTLKCRIGDTTNVAWHRWLALPALPALIQGTKRQDAIVAGLFQQILEVGDS